METLRWHVMWQHQAEILTRVRRRYRNISKAACLWQRGYCLPFSLSGASGLYRMALLTLGDSFCGDMSNGCHVNTAIQEHPKSHHSILPSGQKAKKKNPFLLD